MLYLYVEKGKEKSHIYFGNALYIVNMSYSWDLIFTIYLVINRNKGIKEKAVFIL